MTNAILDKYGLTADVVLVVAMFAALFGSISIFPALYNVGLGVIAVMAVVTVTQVLDIMRSA